MKQSATKLLLATALVAASVPSLAQTTIYSPLGDRNEIAVIDASSGAVTATISEVVNAHGLAITPDQRFLVAGSYMESKPGEQSMPSKPSGVTEDEHEAHHKGESENTNTNVGMSFVSVIDTALNQVVHRIEVQGAVHHTEVTPDGKFAITTHPTVGGISVIDLGSRKVIRVIATGPLPNYAVSTRDGRRIYVSNAGNNTVSEIDATNWIVTRNYLTGSAPEHVVLSPDDSTLYVNNVTAGTVSVISLASDQPVHTYPTGNTPHGVDLSDDGKKLFISSKGENLLKVVDLTSGEISSKKLSPAPYHVTVVPGTGQLFVSSRATEKIWVIDQDTLEIVNEITLNGIGHQMAVALK
jgi:YVTN family beta-propeller protein